MVVPYCRGLSESLKRTCYKYGVQVHFRGGVTIKNLLIVLQGPGSYAKKVGSSTDIDVIGWTVMKNILESLPEHLEKGSSNIKRPHPPFMTTITSLVTGLA